MPRKQDLSQYSSSLAKPRQKTKDHPASSGLYEEGQYAKIPTDQIKPNPHQPRQIFDQGALEELAGSIRDKGVLQPIIVRIENGNEIFLVAGERRLRASKLVGLEEIPAVVTKGNPAEIAIIENLQRENLTPIEEAEALARLMQEHSYTQEQLANIVKKDRTTVTRILSLNRLPAEIKTECARAHIYPRRLLVEIAKQETPDAMTELFEQVKEGGLSSDQLRERTKKGKPRSPRRTGIEAFCGRVDSLSKNIGQMSLDGITGTDKLKIAESLGRLKSQIDRFLESV